MRKMYSEKQIKNIVAEGIEKGEIPVDAPANIQAIVNEGINDGDILVRKCITFGDDTPITIPASGSSTSFTPTGVTWDMLQEENVYVKIYLNDNSYLEMERGQVEETYITFVKDIGVNHYYILFAKNGDSVLAGLHYIELSENELIPTLDISNENHIQSTIQELYDGASNNNLNNKIIKLIFNGSGGGKYTYNKVYISYFTIPPSTVYIRFSTFDESFSNTYLIQIGSFFTFTGTNLNVNISNYIYPCNTIGISNPSSSGTFSLKFVNGELSWIQE